MTREQRRRHLVIWAAVLPLGVLLIVFGWFGRSEWPAQEQYEGSEMQQVPAAGREGTP